MGFRTMIIALMALTGGMSQASAIDLKDMTFTTSAGKVVFSHKMHLNKSSNSTAGFTCKSCHTTGKPSNEHYSMADMEKGKSCGKCHTGEQAFSIGKCTGCHKVQEMTYKVKQTGPVHFSHARHLQSMQCDACHLKLFVAGVNKPATMADMEQGKSCGACHDGSKAFSIDKCNACHPTKEIVFKVKETGPTAFSHQSHLKNYSCSACHTKLYALGANKRVSMAAMEKGKSCGACHNKKAAFGIADCQKCHPVKEIKFKMADAGDVKFSHKAHLNMYKCGDCHTRTFPTRSGNKAVTMTEMEKGKSCGVCHDGKTAFTVKENCESCHSSK